MPPEGCRPGARPSAEAVRCGDRPFCLVRPEESELTTPATRFRDDLSAIFQAALAAVSTPRLLRDALRVPDLAGWLDRRTVHLLAVGKASPFMAAAAARLLPAQPAAGLVIGTHCPIPLPPPLEWLASSHPVPDRRSTRAGTRALELARAAGPDDLLLVLVSGGASSLLALPRPGISLEDKRDTTRQLLRAGADIVELNTVRKHLSAVKGGQLAAAAGRTLALIVSDVVGSDLAVIGSGPTVADPSTFAEAWRVLERYGGDARFPPPVVDLLRRGLAGDEPETPKPGDPRLSAAVSRLIGSRVEAMDAAAAAARDRGYATFVLPSAVTGEAREAGGQLVGEAFARLAAERVSAPACVVASGETTVHVRGDGRGGRNQELALGAAFALEDRGVPAALLSGGTDGVDGPTDAAGAIVDDLTLRRARELDLDAAGALARNDTYPFFAALGDLVLTGPTDTNVADLQILLVENA